MSISEKFIGVIKKILPSPFTIAVLLTLFTVFLALILTPPKPDGGMHILQLGGYWQDGFDDFFKFGMQMMLILVLGHALALTKPFTSLINSTLKYCTSTANAALLVTFITVAMALFNWGLGLIIGALYARKVAEYAQQNKIPLNYPLIGAAGYSGLMVWHGGLSGSAPAAVANKSDDIVGLESAISMSETVFSSMNLVTSILLLIILPLGMYFMGKRVEPQKINLPRRPKKEKMNPAVGAEKLDDAGWLALLFSLIVISIIAYFAFIKPEVISLDFLNLNFIILMLFGFAILLHGSFRKFNMAIQEAIGGAAGIMIQFPLYAGIMGIMKGSGLIGVFSEFFISISNQVTFPLFTFLSAGLVNLFVPSGGGQWAVQGPIIIEAANELQIPLNKCIMALAYGDQITNMLQPFWALPLLGITGLKAKEILPYSAYLLLLGLFIFISMLLIF